MRFTFLAVVIAACSGPAPAVDASAGDGGHDANGDAHVPCNGTCTAPTGECLVEGSSETCLECLGDTDCSGGELCDTAGTHECVGCVDSSTCTSPTASRCDETTSTCAECMGNSDCEHLASTPVCDEGTCVQCASNADCEATEGCSPDTHTCVPFTPGSVATCGECVHDDECMDDADRCVPMQFMGAAHGNFCLRPLSAGCMPPFAVPTPARSSVSGDAPVVYCGVNEAATTCEAVLDTSTTPCADADDCGAPGLADALCATVNGVANRCTYACETSDECISTRPCGPAGHYCGSL